MRKQPFIKAVARLHVLVLLLGIGFAQVSARTFGQQISIHAKNGRLESILREVERQSGYSFFYKKADVEPVANLSVDIDNLPLEQALDDILGKAGFSYDIFEKTVALKKVQPSPSAKAKTGDAAVRQEYLRGRVLDEDGKPLSGASVRIKSDPSGPMAVTGEDGGFIMPMDALGKTLSVSYIGYRDGEMKASAEPEKMTIRLRKLTKDVEEVLVTGIFKKPIGSFTGAATTITAEELQRFGTRNLVSSIRNIDPSFNIIESNQFGSDPNRLPEIQIRGNSHIPNVSELQDQTRTDLNTPLIILDGFESTLRKLYDLNENEVESITLLKDASATAMYGSRGANGVVVVTTRAPQPGKLRLTYRLDGNVEVADLSGYNLMRAREKLELERLAGYYEHKDIVWRDVALKRYYNYLLNEINSGVETDWLALPVRNGIGQRHNLRIEGGIDAFRYSASAQYNDVQGTMKGSARGTFNGNITLAYAMGSFRLQNNTMLSEQRSSQSPYGTFANYVQMNPYWRIYDENGEVIKQLGYPGNNDFEHRWGNLPTNPLWDATLNTFDRGRLSELTNNTDLEWRVLPGLLTRMRLGLTKNISQSDRFRPGAHPVFANVPEEDFFKKGDYRYGVGNAFSYDGSLTVQYDRRMGRHTLFTGFDYNIRYNNRYNYTFLAQGFNHPNFDFIGMATQYEENGTPRATESLVKAVGFTGFANYVYNDRYFTDFMARFDGSSQFGGNRRFAPFWSFGLGWNAHEEDFLRGNPYVNQLRLRASIGATGSQTFDPYQALSTYAYYTDDKYFAWNGAYLMGLGNPDLRWQTNHKNNIGMDGEFFNRFFRLSADYYVETTKDLVSSIELPPSNGFSEYVSNIGQMRNRGLEVRATAFLVNDARMTWSLTGAVIRNENTIVRISDALREAQRSIRTKNDNYAARIYEEGYSSNTIWAVRSLGIDPSNGRELFLGADGQPTYAWRGSDVAAVGTADPKYFGNFSTFFRYRDFSLNLAFGYRFGGQQYNQTLVQRVESSNYRYNVDARVYDDRWQNPGDQAAFKGILVTQPTYKTSRFVQDENSLQLQNVNLQYSLRSKAALARVGLQGLQALSFAANWADVFHTSTIRRERGLNYPFARQMSFNISATF